MVRNTAVRSVLRNFLLTHERLGCDTAEASARNGSPPQERVQPVSISFGEKDVDARVDEVAIGVSS